MSYPVFYVEESDTLPVLFDTFDGGTGASITMTGLAVTDIEIYKDGGITQRSSDSGFTLIDTDGIDIDSTTGLHGFTLDLSDNTDAGFYAVGSWYHVVVNSVTIDAQTVTFIACAFRIVSATRGLAGTALPDAAADAAGGLPISDAGGLDLDAMNTNINDIETDTNSLNDTKIPDTLSLANINAEVDTSITTYGLDHLLQTSVTGSDVADNSIIAKLVDDAATADWDNYDNQTASLEALNVDTDAIIVDTTAIVDDTGTSGVVLANDAITAAKIAADAIGASELASDAVDEIVDQVWDEAASDHVAVGSMGQRHYIIRANTAQAGAAGSITLDASASATDDFYNNAMLTITAGTGAGQTRIIEDYTGSSKVATVSPNWVTNPSSDSVFFIEPFDDIPGASAPSAASIADAVWDEAQADHVAAGSFGVTATEIADILTDTADMQPKLGTPAGADISADIATVDSNVDAILVDTAEIGVAGAGLTDLGGMSTTMKAEVQTEVEAGLEDAGQVMVVTTIATLASQVSFTLTAGSADDDAYNGCFAIIENVSTAAQKAVGYISDYTGSTKTVALIADPGVFTMAATDKISIVPRSFVDLLTATQTSIDAIETDTADMQPKLGTPAGADISADIATVDSNVDAILADTGTDGVVLANDAITAAKIAADAIGASELATDAVNEIVDQVWDEAQADHVAAGSMGLIATEIADILTDTGTTLDGKIDTIDTNVDAILVDTGTTLDARIPAALVGGKMDAVADVTAISGDTTAADNLEASLETIVVGTAITGTLTTTAFTTDLTEATDDHYIGRLICFRTGALAGQCTNITDYAGATKLVTVTAMTEAPANTDAFAIL